MAETDWQEYPAQTFLVGLLFGWSLDDAGFALKLTWRTVWSLVRAGCSLKPCSQGNCGRCHHGCSSDWPLPQIPAQTWSFRSLPLISLTRNWHVRLGAQDILCSFIRTKNLFKPHKDSQNSLERHPDSLSSTSILQGLSLTLGQLSCLFPSTIAHYGLPLVHLPSSQATKPSRSSTLFLFESILSYPWNTTLQEQTPTCLLRPNSNVTFFVNPSITT